MKNNSSISYNALQTPGLRKILEQVSSACREVGIDFFMVGAVARNAWFVVHELPPRGTRDIDFALYIPHVDAYNLLREKLMSTFG